MPITEQFLTQLRARAVAGNPAAARELGRLLNLPPGDPADMEAADLPGERPGWPGEPWLRAALTARADDTAAALLLAGQLLRQIHEDNMLGPSDIAGLAKSRRTNQRRMQETDELYSQVRRSDPGNETAKVGLHVLTKLREGKWLDPVDDSSVSAYSFYLLTMEIYSGSAGSVFRWAVPDLDELRWAFDVVTPLIQDYLFLDGGKRPSAELTLSTVDAGRVVHSIDLGRCVVHDEEVGLDRLSWDDLDVPLLRGEPLPVGHIVAVIDQDYPIHYGFSVHHDI
ncbi:hypothetical protein ACH4S9_12860 [Streptomyces sp. NPDC021225]|uniref:hypothetical protein n=1 Tax=Streptomyces sp. NPDC021225 TaxID=3365121 RepID=UPI0037A6D500